MRVSKEYVCYNTYDLQVKLIWGAQAKLYQNYILWPNHSFMVKLAQFKGRYNIGDERIIKLTTLA